MSPDTSERLDVLCPAPHWISARDSSPEPPLPEHRDAYRLEVCDGAVTSVRSAQPPGRYYADATMDQLRHLFGDAIPDLVIVDWPDIDTRGVMLDVSRKKAPTLETLELMITRLAAMKINHVELYLEAMFAHPGHESVWKDRCAYSAADVEQLHRHATRHHVELLGQQNSLGHMEHWLADPRFAHLAVLPGGYTAPGSSGDSGHEPPACLDPSNPESFDLAAELVSNVALAFECPRVHVGLDEPIDMNTAVWDAIFDVPGAEAPWAGVDNGDFCVPLPPERRVQYMDWVRRLRVLSALDGREMLMWADVMAPHPELIDQLPDGVTLVEWGYEASHPFDARCGRIAAAGRPFWVAPGTSGWSSISGRIPNMVANVRASVEAAATHGAAGMLVTSWGTHPDAINWPGFLAGAAASWNRSHGPQLAASLDLAVGAEPDSGLGEAWCSIGTVHDLVSPSTPESGTISELFRSSGMAGIGLALGGMTDAMLCEVDAELERALGVIRAANGAAPDFELIRAELDWSTRCLRWGVGMARHRLSWPTAPAVAWLREEHNHLVTEHERIWTARNRPCGLADVTAELVGLLGGV